MSSTINPVHQTFILARLGEFCTYNGRVARSYSDPWSYMRQKLEQLEPPLTALKEELLEATRRRLLAQIKSGDIDEEGYSDFKLLLDRLLSRGDFADVAMHLNAQNGSESRATIAQLLSSAKISHVFIEERKPAGERSPHWEKLVGELYGRLGLDEIGKLIGRRKKITRRRRAAALKLMRRNVAEYCSVVKIPTDANQTFTPFMLPRVEALIAACLRFLNRYR